MNAATRIRASCRGWRVRWAGVVGAGAPVTADAVSEGAVPGMISNQIRNGSFRIIEGTTRR